MANVDRRFPTFKTCVYRVPTPLTTRTMSGIESAINNITPMGDLQNVGDIVESIAEIELALYDEDYVAKVAGQANQENIPLEVVWNYGGSQHSAIITQSKGDLDSWVIEFRSSDDDATYLLLDAWINNKNYSQTQDGVATLSFDLVRSGELTIVADT